MTIRTAKAAAAVIALAAVAGAADESASPRQVAAKFFRLPPGNAAVVAGNASKAFRIAASHGALAKVAVELRDEDGSPVEGATVTLRSQDGDKAVTGPDGRAVFEGAFPATIQFTASGDGIYSRDGRMTFTELSDDGQHWTAPDTFPLTVRRRGVAHPMSVRKVASSRFPPANAVMSYDLFKDDFLPPHGNGEVADFTILYSHVSDSPPWDNGNGNFASRLEIVPAGETEGFSVAEPFSDFHRLPLAAPEKLDSDTISVVSRVVRGQTPESSYDSTKRARNFFMFKARGRYGIIALDGIENHYNFAQAAPFAIEFRFNEEPGVTGLEAAEAADAAAVGETAIAGGAPDAPRAPDTPLLVRTGPDSAKFFGTPAQGGIIPATLAADAIASLDGIEFLSFDESVESVPERIFENSASLRTLFIGNGTLMEIGSRAFAGCTNLSCVAVVSGRPFDIFSDTFDGASSNLTCVFNASYGRDGALRRNVEPWSRVATASGVGPNAIVEGDILFAIEKSGLRILRYLGEAADVLSIPETIKGRPVVSADAAFFRSLGDVRAVDFPATLADSQIDAWEFSDKTDFFFRGRVPYLARSGSSKFRVFKIGLRGLSEETRWHASAELLPEWADPTLVMAGGIAEEDGWRYLKGDGFACVLRYSGTAGETLKIPETLGGLPVAEIGSCALSRGKFKRLEFPPSVRRIGYCAFAGCQSLEGVAWNDGLEEIGHGAFFACFQLKAGKLPGSVKSVGLSAFDAVASAPAPEDGAQVVGGDVKHRITVRPEEVR